MCKQGNKGLKLRWLQEIVAYKAYRFFMYINNSPSSYEINVLKVSCREIRKRSSPLRTLVYNHFHDESISGVSQDLPSRYNVRNVHLITKTFMFSVLSLSQCTLRPHLHIPSDQYKVPEASKLSMCQLTESLKVSPPDET